MRKSSWAERTILHAISRDHLWKFECIDCRSLTAIHQRLSDANKNIEEFDAKVAEADKNHAHEPMPRYPHEGDYYRGLRDGLKSIVDEE